MSPEHFLQITNLLPEAALLVTPEGTVVAANNSTGRLFCVPVAEVCDRPIAHFLANPSAVVASYLGSCARTTGPIPGRVNIRRADSQVVPCQATGAVIRTASGPEPPLIFLRLVPTSEAPTQFVLLNRQIEELTREVARRCRAEGELEDQRLALENANEELAVINEELQAANEELEVSNEDLRSQQQELQRASEQKDRFLAMLAHELRNPLAPIRTAVHLLGVAPQDSPVWKRSRDTVERQVSHMSRLIDDLLDVSRITTGRIRLQRRSLDLAALVQETAEDYRQAMEAEGLTLNVAVPEEPVWLYGDAVRLSQVLGNLLENARKFTPIGGRVGVRLRAEADRFAVLTVEDTGIGIPPDELPYIFEAFAQADRSLDRAGGGLGLGLALVKGLVALHRGEVAVRSEGIGQGAEFTLRFHLEPVAAAPVQASSGESSRRLPRVLVIDDNHDAAGTLRDMLEIYEYEVAVAHTGEEGITLARQLPPAVVLCDLGLPGMSGYEVAEALRRDPALSAVCLVAVTGYGGDDERHHSDEAGFDHHLIKPVEPETLIRLLERASRSD